MKKSLFCLLLLSTISLSPAFAQDKGRLPDGRAYRVDSEGNRVVDYIADLEMNVDSLNRQVVGLEDELQQKIQLVDELKKNGGCKPELRERDLIESKAEPVKTDCSQELSKVRTDLASQFESQKRQLEEQHVLEFSSLREKIASLQTEISQLSSSKASAEPGVEKRDIENAKRELQEERNDKSDLASQLQQLREELSETKSSLAAKNDAYELLNTRFAAAQKRIETLGEARASLNVSAAGSSSAVNENPSAEEREKQGNPKVASRESAASLSITRDRALESLKGTVSGDMNRVQGLIASRDKLVKEYKETKKARVDFMPTAALSSSNESIADLGRRLESANSMRQLSEITASVRQIEQRMQSDIALISRLKRIQ